MDENSANFVTSAEVQVTRHKFLSSVPKYDDVVERNNIEILRKGGDLVLRNGDIAVTRWGDLMLNNEDHSAFLKLVQEWRYNYPTLKVMFESSFDTTRHERAQENDLSTLFQQAASKSPHPMTSFDYDEYHRINEESGAKKVARGAYAGSVAVILSKFLQSFCANICATRDEWEKSAPLFGGCSVGQVLEASANNVRHSDQWATTRPPSPQQLKSIRILSAALHEPIAADGTNHRFSREISPETLQLISGGDFQRLEINLFAFAKNLLWQRQRRLPSLAPNPASAP
jgi:hypothetical protein